MLHQKSEIMCINVLEVECILVKIEFWLKMVDIFNDQIMMSKSKSVSFYRQYEN